MYIVQRDVDPYRKWIALALRGGVYTRQLTSWRLAVDCRPSLVYRWANSSPTVEDTNTLPLVKMLSMLNIGRMHHPGTENNPNSRVACCGLRVKHISEKKFNLDMLNLRSSLVSDHDPGCFGHPERTF